jgi:hypothetical protein
MNDLLNLAMKAHGGLERWKQVQNMQAKVTLNGTLWRIKGRPDGLSGVVMRLNTKEPDLTITPFPKPGTAGPAAKVRILHFKNLPPFRHDPGLQVPRLRYSPGLAPTTRLNALLNAASDT